MRGYWSWLWQSALYAFLYWLYLHWGWSQINIPALSGYENVDTEPSERAIMVEDKRDLVPVVGLTTQECKQGQLPRKGRLLGFFTPNQWRPNIL